MDETNLDFPIGTSIIDLVISHRVLTTKKNRQIGLYPGQDLLLIELLRQDHRSQNELVRALNVDHSTIAKSANRLFKTGVIDSQKSAKDKRVTIISLTTKGRALAEQAAEIWRDVEQAVREELSPEDVALFLTYAKKITATFNQRSNEAGQPNQSC